MRKFACIFPGQGSQTVGMAANLLKDPLSEEVFREANEALRFDLTKLIMEGPEEQLALTINAQPAILATSFAAWKQLVKLFGMKAMPSFLAGHSLGEFTALAAAGVLELHDAIRLVRLRGKLMQEAVPVGEGAMAALLGADEAKVFEMVETLAQGQILNVANINAPGQIAISGNTEAVDRAIAQAKDYGVKRAVKLNVSAPFHSRLMHPAREKFAEALKTCKFMSPFCPIIHNTTARPNTDPLKMPELLARQVDGPVRWSESVEYMLGEEVVVFVEVGHGNVLQGLVKKIAPKDFQGVITGFASSEEAGGLPGVLESPVPSQ